MVQRGYVLKVVAAIVTAPACIGVLATWVASGNGGSKAAAWRPGHPPVRDGWTRLPTSPLAARHDLVGAFVGTSLLIVGGSSEPPCPAGASCAVPAEPSLRDAAAFDSVTGEWHTIMDAPEPVAGFNVAIIGHMIYVLSASDGRADGRPSFLSYDVGRDVWATLPELPDAEATFVAAGHTVVAIAHSDEHACAVDAAFDVDTQKWRILPDDPLGPSFGREAVWAGDRLLLAASDLALSSKAQQPAVNALATLDRSLDHWSARARGSAV